MARRKKSILKTLITLLVLAVVAWMKFKEEGGSVGDVIADITQKHTGGSEGSSSSASLPRGADLSSLLTPVSTSSSKFEILENCTLIENRGNDGDSFHVMTRKGDQELRLYYVDAPESSAREYRDGNTNYKRIAQQGAAMGGLSQAQTTQIGMEAKKFVKSLLKGKKFRVATVWESVYNSRRSYAYILVPYEGQERYLHELVIAHGLGRIHTKPYMLPDSTASSRHKSHLYKIEKFAKQENLGAWGL